MKKTDDFLDKLFRNISEREMREAGLEAIRACVESPQDGYAALLIPRIWYQKLIGILSPDMRMEDSRPGALDMRHFQAWNPTPVNDDAAWRHDMLPMAFLRWLERAGLAVQLDKDYLVLTDAGLRLAFDDHPLRPRALDELRTKCDVGLKDALDRIEDAQMCLASSLPRPAIVLLGLAFEELIQVVVERLASKKTTGGALDRQRALRQTLESRPKNEDREHVLNALNVADSIRDARNKAAHVAASEWNLYEAEDLLLDGMRAFPKLATLLAERQF
jgi:hypothetical protein